MEAGSEKWQQSLKVHAQALGVSLDRRDLRQLSGHACEMLRWNPKKNLTRITEPVPMLVKHYLDALSVVPFLPKQGRVLDIGSGGGFPGIPIKISSPKLKMQLIEASRKKVHFLKHVIRCLNLKDIQAEHMRAETLRQQISPSQRFDVVISRAVSSLEAFYKMAAPLVATDGAIIAMKSKSLHEEIRALSSTAEAGGGFGHPPQRSLRISVKPLRLPLLELERSIVIIHRAAV
jgi:16S rRNA (guanine527-N7)-methyltransferase